jgi:hypothetical protein
VDGCEEADCGFVIASCDGTEAFERMEPAFNLVAQAVELAVQAPSPRMQGVLRDDGLHTASSDGVVDGLPRVARVGDAGPAPGMLHQFFGLGGLVPMSLGQRDVDRLAFRRGDRVDLGRKASSRTAQMIASDPPFPPAASWCARTVVASRMEPVSSTSMASSLKSRSQIPISAQRLNRLYTVFHGPKRSGRSRQATPVLVRQMTALTKSRSPRLETGPVRTGRRASMRFHSASLSSCRCTVSVDHTRRHLANPIRNSTVQPRFRTFPGNLDLTIRDTP